jgi:quercetin dioxygenase-like cupin family protein
MMMTTMLVGAGRRQGGLLLSGLLLPLLAGCAAKGVAGAPGDAQAVRASVLMTQALPRDVGTEARVLRVDLPPGAESPPHRHPGAIFAYVLEGEVESAVDDGEPRTFRRGETWYEAPGQLHRVSRNPGGTGAASLLVFFLTEPGRPVRVEDAAH